MPPKPTTKKASTGAAKPAKKDTKPASKPAAKPSKKDTKGSGKTSKAVAKGKSATKTTKAIQKKKSVWEKNPRNFGIGNDIQPKRDLTRFTKWPRYVVLQRKKRILQLRLTVPPALNQFTNTLDTNAAANLFKLLNKYRPEDKIAKRNRLLKVAKGELKPSTTKPLVVKCGINHVTKLVEDKKAALVIIAHDVDPIELVVFLPALCRKQGVPYCIVKGKARLGQVVHKKTATVLALTGVANEHRAELAQLVTIAQSQFNEKYEEHKKRWGASVLGLKSQAKLRKQAREAAKEAKDKLKYL